MQKVFLGFVLVFSLVLVGCERGVIPTGDENPVAGEDSAGMDSFVGGVETTDGGLTVESGRKIDVKVIDERGEEVEGLKVKMLPPEAEAASLAQKSLVYRGDAMTIYYGEECPHCHRLLMWLPELEAAYPELKIEEKEVWHNEANAAEAQAKMKELGHVFEGVPTVILSDKVIVGFQAEAIKNMVEQVLE